MHYMMKILLNTRRTASADLYALIGLIIYFVFCDVHFYTKLSSENLDFVNSKDHLLTSRYTVKFRLLAHFSHYIYQPVCKWAEDSFHISTFPGMSPNLITFTHFTIAVICGVLFASSKLYWRRLAVLLFSVRTMLDNLDGVIYRAQAKVNSMNLISGWGTWGFWADAIADTLGSLFILLGTGHLYWRFADVNNTNKRTSLLPWFGTSLDETDQQQAMLIEANGDSVDRRTKPHIVLIALMVIVNIAARALLWDHYNEMFHKLLGVKRLDAVPERQFEALNYTSTWLCFWLWTFNSADALLNFTLIAIYFDKTWRWLIFSSYSALPTILFLTVGSQVHLAHLRTFLNVTAIP